MLKEDGWSSLKLICCRLIILLLKFINHTSLFNNILFLAGWEIKRENKEKQNLILYLCPPIALFFCFRSWRNSGERIKGQNKTKNISLYRLPTQNLSSSRFIHLLVFRWSAKKFEHLLLSVQFTMMTQTTFT